MKDTASIKKHNIDMIKTALLSLDYATKQQIAAVTGLSVSTCNTVLNELEYTGEVTSRRIQPNNVGRSAKEYHLDENFSSILCLFFKVTEGKKTLYYAVLNLAGETICEHTGTYPIIDAPFLLDSAAALFRQYPNIKAVSIGIPGVPEGDYVRHCDIEELIDVPLAAMFRDHFEVPVILEDDMHVMAYGYYKKECSENSTVTITIFPRNILPGSGTVIDGKVIKGASSFAGQIGFLPYDMSQAAQKELMNERQFFPIAAKGIISIIALLNPDVIILSGDLASEALPEKLYATCLEYISKEHIPEMFFVDHIDEYYVEGLYALALEYGKETD